MRIPPFTLERQFQEIGSDIEEAVMKVLKGGQYIGCLLYTSDAADE